MGRSFREQLEKYGAPYFDYYMPHNMFRSYHEAAECLGTLASVRRKKEEGKTRGIGSPFHVDAEPLEEVLSEHPELDFMQLQLSYIDRDSLNVQSRQCYEVYRRYRKDVTAMEPVKGETLADVPPEAEKLMEAHAPGMTPVPWTVRFAVSREGIIMALLGMPNYNQLLDDIAYIQDSVPLTEEEEGIVARAAEIVQSAIATACTSCQYCMEGCPKQIPMPKYFSLYNQYSLFGEKPNFRGYCQNYGGRYRKVGDCTGYRRYEAICPQHLLIVQHMKEITEVSKSAKQGVMTGKNSGDQQKWRKTLCNLNTPILYYKTVAVDVYNKEE